MRSMDDENFYEMVERLSKKQADLSPKDSEFYLVIFRVLNRILTNLDLNFPEAYKSVITQLDKNNE